MKPLPYDNTDEQSIIDYALKLKGHTFQWVIDLGIKAEGASDAYDNPNYKGGMGNLLEERYFCYKKNSDDNPDFEKIGLELKTTCIDPVKRKSWKYKAGERLVITMIPFQNKMSSDYEGSHLCSKLENVLLIVYLRNKEISKLDQEIKFIGKMQIPAEDLEIIKQDYSEIVETIQQGRAQDLSESATNYLGACTKGSNAEKSMRAQFYAPGTKAKSRAFCLKQSYMNSLLQSLFGGKEENESVVKDPSVLKEKTFEEIVAELIKKNIGKTDKQLAQELNLKYSPTKKDACAAIIRNLLGVKTSNIAEFEKSNTQLKVVRLEPGQKSLKESLSLSFQSFESLMSERDWEESELCRYFSENRFFFVFFEKTPDGPTILRGSKFWSMPTKDIEGPLKECWLKTRDTIEAGVQFTIKFKKDTDVIWRIENNLPGMMDNPVAHVRPHASRSAYKLSNGLEIGDIEKDGDQLPDGQWMTKQSFWLNRDYVYEIVTLDDPE